MSDKNIQIRHRQDGQWGNLYPHTLTENVYDKDGKNIDEVLLEERQKTLDSLVEQKKLLGSMVGVNIWDYEHLIPNKTSENWDWSIPFEHAVNEAMETGLHTVILPHYDNGDYHMKPFSFEDKPGLTIRGIGAVVDPNVVYFWGDEDLPTNHVRIKFNQKASVGFQFSGEEMGDWRTGNSKIENIWLCGNNLVDTVVNGAYGLSLINVRASHGKKDGVVFEDYTYPALIRDSQLGPNGRHGLYVKGPMTTVYNVERVNTSLNGGYGFYITGGAHARFTDCLAQSNTVGGLKITKRNDLYGQTQNYLHSLTFENFYAEANGKLDAQDAKYEGNYALVVDRTAHPNQTGQVAPQNIVFNGGSLNAGNNQQVYNLSSVIGLSFNNVGGLNHQKATVNAGEAQALEITTASTSAWSKAPYPFIHKYFLRDLTHKKTLVVEDGGRLSSRGRVNVIPFFVTGLTAGASKVAKPFGNASNEGFVPQGYPIKEGSIVGVKVVSGKGTGTVGVSVLKGKAVGLTYFLQNTLTLDTANDFTTEIFYNPLEHKITDEFVGIRIHPSSNYANSNNEVIVYLLVEE